MCGIWNQNQWRMAANDETSGYTLLGEYKNGQGDVALMMKNMYGTITNVYDVRGVDTMAFARRRAETEEDRLNRANQAMTKHGFSPIVAAIEPVRVPWIAELATTNQQAERPFGRTLAEWKQVGKDNQNREPADHIHPDLPEDREPTMQEDAAYRASLTEQEEFLISLVAPPNPLLASPALV